MDGLDQKILAIFQKDCTIKAEAIAETVGLSTSAVQRRLRALRSAGVIRSEVAVVDPRAITGTMTFIAGLEIGRENYEALQKLRQWTATCKNIQQLYYVTGDFDLIAIILAPNVEVYDAIIEALMRHNPLINRITTNVVLRAEKVGLEVPMAED